MNNGLKIFFSILSLIAIPTTIWAAGTVSSLKRVCYSVAKFKIVEVSFQKITLAFLLKVKNPSKINIAIKGYDIQILINDLLIGNIISSDTKIIKAKTHASLTIPATINIDKTTLKNKILKDVINLFSLQNYKDIIVTLKGKLNGGILAFNVPIEIDSKFTLAEIITIMDEPETDPC